MRPAVFLWCTTLRSIPSLLWIIEINIGRTGTFCKKIDVASEWHLVSAWAETLFHTSFWQAKTLSSDTLSCHYCLYLNWWFMQRFTADTAVMKEREIYSYQNEYRAAAVFFFRSLWRLIHIWRWPQEYRFFFGVSFFSRRGRSLDIYSSKMIPYDFNNPPKFCFCTTIFSELFQQLLDGSPWDLVKTFRSTLRRTVLALMLYNSSFSA